MLSLKYQRVNIQWSFLEKLGNALELKIKTRFRNSSFCQRQTVRVFFTFFYTNIKSMESWDCCLLIQRKSRKNDGTLLSFDTCIVLEFSVFVCYNSIQPLDTGETFLSSISVCFCRFLKPCNSLLHWSKRRQQKKKKRRESKIMWEVILGSPTK